MKKKVNVEDGFLEHARATRGVAKATHLGFEAQVRHAAGKVLRTMLGSEPGAIDVPRRRTKAPNRKAT